MPTYDFECVKCHHKFEQKLSFNDEGVAECPRCRGEARRLFSAVPVIFKGSGFYVTDHRKAGAADSTTKPEEKKITKVSAAKPEATDSTTKPEEKKVTKVSAAKPEATTE